MQLVEAHETDGETSESPARENKCYGNYEFPPECRGSNGFWVRFIDGDGSDQRSEEQDEGSGHAESLGRIAGRGGGVGHLLDFNYFLKKQPLFCRRAFTEGNSSLKVCT